MKSAARQGNATAVRASDRSSLAAGSSPEGASPWRRSDCRVAPRLSHKPTRPSTFHALATRSRFSGEPFRPRRTRSGRLRRSHEAGEIGRCVIRTRGLVCATASTRSSSRRSPRDVAAAFSPLGQSPAAWSISSASGLTPTRFGATIHVLVGDSQLIDVHRGPERPCKSRTRHRAWHAHGRNARDRPLSRRDRHQPVARAETAPAIRRESRPQPCHERMPARATRARAATRRRS
jgi:hypothetical protein